MTRCLWCTQQVFPWLLVLNFHHSDTTWINSDAICLKLFLLSSALINLLRLLWETAFWFLRGKQHQSFHTVPFLAICSSLEHLLGKQTWQWAGSPAMTLLKSLWFGVMQWTRLSQGVFPTLSCHLQKWLLQEHHVRNLLSGLESRLSSVLLGAGGGFLHPCWARGDTG